MAGAGGRKNNNSNTKNKAADDNNTKKGGGDGARADGADGDQEAKDGRAQGDCRQQCGDVQRSDDAGVDEVVDGSDDHCCRHGHAQMYQRPVR